MLILIDDGKLELVCEKIENKIVYAKALNSHSVNSKRKINLPKAKLSMPFLSNKDKSDILFATIHHFDWIAASFVNTKKDVLEIRNFLDNNNGKNIKIISKIESELGVKNLDDIIDNSDSIMIARGDLGCWNTLLFGS